MRWIALLAFSMNLSAATERTMIDRIQRWDYQDGVFEMLLSSYPKVIEVPADSKVAPCLENAFKAEMEVLITLDPKGPRVKSCKIYSQGFPFTPSMIEHDEDKKR